jgi:FkbM family methyltransferase
MAPAGSLRYRVPMPKYRLTTSSAGRFLTIPTDAYVGKSIELYGEWSFGEILALGKFLQPTDNVIEVGANIGAHTVFLARDLCPKGLVHAFEPRRALFQLLCANLALNDMTNVFAHQLALGEEEGLLLEGPMPEDRTINAGAYTLGALPGSSERILIRPLDSMADALGKTALIKADVEGHEIAVIRGAAAIIARDRPALYVENDRLEQSEALISHIMGLDYDLYWHIVPLFRPENHAGTAQNIFGSIASFNMLCFPSERAARVSHLPRISDPVVHPLRR